ncbi:hypothetical protein MATL_G00069150 [Megalops atlanticus]|uniref:BZIP domain-containing protein n=1 Tax=Megalops atlanticus TaxID=7932 RepID=A0A9D3Q9H5_MEGAT|nr:hypothetical protein MATL_G00069150 [Megalops atlanticus]
MCAAANFAFSLWRNCEGLANPDRLHGGVSMPAPASGALPHQTSRDVEMDFAWQELMAITELQDFEVPGESPFDSTVCHAQDTFGMTPPPTELHPFGCGANPEVVFDQPYTELTMQQGLQLHQIFPPAQNGFHLDRTILPQSAPHMGAFRKPRAAPTLQTGVEPMGRDERRALALHIPFPLEQIVNLPVDDFNELLAQHALSEPQLALVRDIRRRGKNKVAAQNCRKRKLESIVLLEDELGRLRARREQLVREHADFQSSLALARCRLSELCTKVSTWLQDHDRCPYSMDHFSFQHTGDGGVH